jgi:tRNA nucleotidyltransferase (CCA-adding enzyme)
VAADRTLRAPLDRVPRPWAARFRRIGRLAAERGLSAGLVGGCVRDLFLRRSPLDWDVVVESRSAGTSRGGRDGTVGALVKEAASDFRAEVVAHPAFLTYALRFPDGASLDVATARRETYPSPASLPVVEPASLADDFARRDFAVNAMAADLAPARWGALIDPCGGFADLRQGVLRVLHPRSFEDDPTRLFRAARYAGRYSWSLEAGTQAAAQAAVDADLPLRLSPARRRAELERLLEERDPRPALRLLSRWGAWNAWSPHWQWRPSFETAWPSPGPEPVLYGLLTLCEGSAPQEAVADLRALEFPGASAETVRRVLAWRAPLRKGGPGDAPPARLSPAESRFLRRAVGAKLVRRWGQSAPLLDGDDLRRLGYPPGPLYHEVLRSLRSARWRGEVRTRADETRHVIDNFPRKK